MVWFSSKKANYKVLQLQIPRFCTIPPTNSPTNSHGDRTIHKEEALPLMVDVEAIVLLAVEKAEVVATTIILNNVLFVTIKLGHAIYECYSKHGFSPGYRPRNSSSIMNDFHSYNVLIIDILFFY